MSERVRADGTQPLVVAEWRENAHDKINTYDFRTHDGRHAALRFISWAMSRGYTVTLKPGQITVK